MTKPWTFWEEENPFCASRHTSGSQRASEFKSFAYFHMISNVCAPFHTTEVLPFTFPKWYFFYIHIAQLTLSPVFRIWLTPHHSCWELDGDFFSWPGWPKAIFLRSGHREYREMFKSTLLVKTSAFPTVQSLQSWNNICQQAHIYNLFVFQVVWIFLLPTFLFPALAQCSLSQNSFSQGQHFTTPSLSLTEHRKSCLGYVG